MALPGSPRVRPLIPRCASRASACTQFGERLGRRSRLATLGGAGRATELSVRGLAFLTREIVAHLIQHEIEHGPFGQIHSLVEDQPAVLHARSDRPHPRTLTPLEPSAFMSLEEKELLNSSIRRPLWTAPGAGVTIKA